jgi:hypothetical protein
MPRGRKSATTRASSGGQSRLSFNNRVTKTSAQAQKDEEIASSKKISQIEDNLRHEQPESEVVDVKNEPEVEPTQQKVGSDVQPESEQIVEEEKEPSKASARRRVKAVKGKDQRELAAEKITDAQLRKYWQKEEESRLAPRGMVTFSALLPILSPRCIVHAVFTSIAFGTRHPLPRLIRRTNLPFCSTSRIHPPPRKDPPTLRPLVPIRPLHRHPTLDPLAASKYPRPATAH